MSDVSIARVRTYVQGPFRPLSPACLAAHAEKDFDFQKQGIKDGTRFQRLPS